MSLFPPKMSEIRGSVVFATLLDEESFPDSAQSDAYQK